MIPWKDHRENTVWVETFRKHSSETVALGMIGPQNVVLARWAKMINGMMFDADWVKCVEHKRFTARLPVPGWIHLVVVHHGALPGRDTGEYGGYAFCAEAALDARIRQIVSTPLRPGWGVSLGVSGESPQIIPCSGWGAPAWYVRKRGWAALAKEMAEKVEAI